MSVSFACLEPFDLDRLVNGLAPLQARKAANPVQLGGTQNAVTFLKPRMDLHEDSEKNLVTATFEFPGVSKANINIEMHNGKLTVSTETQQSEEHNEDGYAIQERRHGKYLRTLQLPQGIKDGEIKAVMENGLLTVTFPKSSPELAPKRISIA